MTGLKTVLNVPEGWGRTILDEAAANDLSMAGFIWKIFLLGYEVYKEEGL